MGSKKDMTKEQLLAINKKERFEREIVRKQSDAANIVQKFVRSYMSNSLLTK